MSTWNKDISQSLADAVTSVLTGVINEDSKAKQNAMMKKGKGEPADQTKGKNELPEENGKKKSQLDPVGKEDSDVDNDGDSDSSDEYLMKRRKAISKSIRNTSKTGKKVALNGKKEKVTINPVMGEEVEAEAYKHGSLTAHRRAGQKFRDKDGDRRKGPLFRPLSDKEKDERIAHLKQELKLKRARDAERAKKKTKKEEVEYENLDELKTSTKIRAAAQRSADAEGERSDIEWDGRGSVKRAEKLQRSADKMRKQIATKHGERAAKGVDNLSKIRSGLKRSHSRVRNSQKSDPLANRPSTSIAKSGERKGKVTRSSAERLKAAIRNRPKQRNEEFQEERAAIREAIEHSFDTVFQYSNAEEEAFRNDWMEEFDSIVSGTEPSAYLDPLQRRVYYIEGLSPQQAADRYLTHIRPNRVFAGGEYKASSRGGDVYASSQHQGQGPSRVHHPKFRGNYKTEY